MTVKRFLQLALPLLVSSNNASATSLFDTELTTRTVKDTVTELDEQHSIPMYEQESPVASEIGCVRCSFQAECVAVGFGHCIDGCCGDHVTLSSGSKSAKPTGSMLSRHPAAPTYGKSYKPTLPDYSTYSSKSNKPSTAGGTKSPSYGSKSGSPNYGSKSYKPSTAGGTKSPSYGSKSGSPHYGSKSYKPSTAGGTKSPSYGSKSSSPNYGSKSGGTKSPSYGSKSGSPHYGSKSYKPSYGSKSSSPNYRSKSSKSSTPTKPATHPTQSPIEIEDPAFPTEAPYIDVVFTFSPTESPISTGGNSKAPTKSPIQIPLTPSPTQPPVTSPPNSSPTVKPTPGVATPRPSNAAPTKSPTGSGGDTKPPTKSPIQIPLTQSPTNAPVTPSPSLSPSSSPTVKPTHCEEPYDDYCVNGTWDCDECTCVCFPGWSTSVNGTCTTPVTPSPSLSPSSSPTVKPTHCEEPYDGYCVNGTWDCDECTCVCFPGWSTSVNGTCTRTEAPTSSPTDIEDPAFPTEAPIFTIDVTMSPSESLSPSQAPVTSSPSSRPSNAAPSQSPIELGGNSKPPTKSPIQITPTPSPITSSPSSSPSGSPSNAPVTPLPSAAPSSNPSSSPTQSPSGSHSEPPTPSPSSSPSSNPTTSPSGNPSFNPSASPTQRPSGIPSSNPSSSPTQSPSGSPSEPPTPSPSSSPSSNPTTPPSGNPSFNPSVSPTQSPSGIPTLKPTAAKTPTSIPTQIPVPSGCKAEKVKLASTTGAPLHMFEVQVMSGGINAALQGTASQSSTFLSNEAKYGAQLSIDGSGTTFSHTQSGVGTWWMVNMTETTDITSVLIVNRYCPDSSDSGGCLCRLTNAELTVYDGNDNVLSTSSLGDTCDQRVLEETISCPPAPSPSSSPTTFCPDGQSHPVCDQPYDNFCVNGVWDCCECKCTCLPAWSTDEEGKCTVEGTYPPTTSLFPTPSVHWYHDGHDIVL